MNTTLPTRTMSRQHRFPWKCPRCIASIATALAAVIALVLFTPETAKAASPLVFDVTAPPYSASKNGTVDVSDIIQRALDDAATALNTEVDSSDWHTGVAVIFPQGDYLITKRLVLSANATRSQVGIMIRGDGPAKSRILCKPDPSPSPAQGRGALLIQPTTSDRISDINLQIEDLCFKADGAIDGPAIEVAPISADANDPRMITAPKVRGVTIGQRSSMQSQYFTCGFKAQYVTRAAFSDFTVKLHRNLTEAGIRLDNSYQFKVMDSRIESVKTGIWHEYGGEGGALIRSVISNVDTGIHMLNSNTGEDTVLMSASGFNIAKSTIAAKNIGLDITKKKFINISNDVFPVDTGTSPTYQAISLKNCTQAIISGNSFVSSNGTCGTGVSLVDGAGTDSVMICDNTFTSFQTAALVGAGVVDTTLFNNAFNGVTTILSDSGTGTRYIAGGAPVSPVLSPMDTEDSDSSFSWGDMTNVYDVTALPYNANCTSGGNSSGAVQAAATAAVNYLNANAGSKAVLYFPAGYYILKQPILLDKIPTGTTLQICGDGRAVSAIVSMTGGGNNTFSINTEKNARVDIHNLMLLPSSKAGGPAFSLTNNGTSSTRSLYMHDVVFTTKANFTFSCALIGTNLCNPFLDNVAIDFSEPVGKGVSLSGGSGFRSESVRIKGGSLETGIDINNTSGDITIGYGAILEASVGVKVVSSNGNVVLQGEHLNCDRINSDVSNAASAAYMTGEHLNQDLGEGYDPGITNDHASAKFTNCAKVDVRYAFHHVATRFTSLGRKSVWLSGNGNPAGNIYANMFSEKAGTNIQVDAGSSAAVSNNRFLRTDLLDSSTVPTASSSNYPLNGKNGELYLIRNKGNGNYLGTNATSNSVSCPASLIDDYTKWTVDYDESGGNAAVPYSFKKNLVAKYLQSTASGADCAAPASDTSATQWQIENKGNCTYTIRQGANLLTANATTGSLSLLPDSGSAYSRWEIYLVSDIVEMMDATTFSTNSTASTWNGIYFHKRFPNPPAVFLGSLGNNSTDPAVLRVKDLSSTGCSQSLINWNNTPHSDEDVGLLAVPKGNYYSGALHFQAGTVNISCSGNATTTNWVTCNFTKTFDTPPIVFAQYYERNGVGPGIAQVRNITATSFDVRLQKSTSTSNWFANQPVDYIAVSQGSNNRAITGIGTCPATPMAFNRGADDFAPVDPGFVASVQTSEDVPPYMFRYNASSLTKDTVNTVLQPLSGSASGSKPVGWLLFDNNH